MTKSKKKTKNEQRKHLNTLAVCTMSSEKEACFLDKLIKICSVKHKGKNALNHSVKKTVLFILKSSFASFANHIIILTNCSMSHTESHNNSVMTPVECSSCVLLSPAQLQH